MDTNELDLYPRLRDFMGGGSTHVPPTNSPELATAEERRDSITVIVQEELPDAAEAKGGDYEYQDRFEKKELSITDIMPNLRPNSALVRDFKDIAEVGNKDLFYGNGVEFDMTY